MFFLCFPAEYSQKLKRLSRQDLFDTFKALKGKKLDEKLEFMQEQVKQMTSCPSEKSDVLVRALRCFKSEFKQKWTAANYTEARFLKNNEKWLKSSIELPMWCGQQKPGRPTKKFEELSDRSKRRRTKDLREKVPVEELTFAAQVKMGTSGNTDTSKLMKDITLTPSRSKKIRKIISSAAKEIKVQKHSPVEALIQYVEGNFTRKQYNVIHGANKAIYPCYSILQHTKKDCYPDEASINVTESGFAVRLQALLDHTVTRLCAYLKEVIDTLSESEKENLQLITKWGCDGSNQSQWKQKFSHSEISDANIFISSLVPVRLIVSVDGVCQKIVWQNPVPSSVRFCRPIRMRFVHETKDVTKEEIAFVKEQAENLEKTQVEGSCMIVHTLLFTMVDGKVCNAATDTASTLRCYICGQTSKNFNELKKVDDSQLNTEALTFGLSILHARIRFFESLLHVSYKIPLKKWRITSQEEKAVVEENKKNIQKRFRDEMGLLVDIPKSGYGNTNDGNTSRRFFADAETSASITGINIDLLKRFRVILEVISSGHEIDHDKFETYTQSTARLYIDLYGWHPMSPTVHKVLMHGGSIIAHAILPIGQLSEEAAEARNKHFREYRTDYSRKTSRIECNRDILNRLLLTSDPLLSSRICSKQKQRKREPFTEEAVNILLAGRENSPQAETDEEDEYD